MKHRLEGARRRLLFALAAGALTVHGAPTFAQNRSKPWRIGYLSTGTRQAVTDASTTAGAFLRSLHEMGLVEGRDFVIEWRFAEGHRERLKPLAADLRQRRVDVVFAVSSFS